MASGEARPLMRGNTGMDAGNPLNVSGQLWGSGENLFMANRSAVYKLTPAAMPDFFSFELPDRAASVKTAFSNSSIATVGSGTIELDASPFRMSFGRSVPTLFS
jgi:hypothetical protein